MKRAGRIVSRLARSFRTLTRVVAPLTLALGGLGGLSFTAIFNQTRKWADEVGKLSDELGIAVDKLMGLRLAAELTGTTTAILTKGLQRMNRRIGEANAGYGEAVKGLSDLGLAAKDLAGLTAFEQFAKIADATGKMATQADKAAAVFTLFGRQGSMLLNMFALQEEGLRQISSRFDELAGKVTRLDFKQIETMNDEIVFLQTALKGFSFRALVELAPTIGAIINLLTDGFVHLRKTIVPTMVSGIQKGINKILEVSKDLLPFIASGILTLRAAVTPLAMAAKTIVTGVRAIAEGIEFVIAKLTVASPAAAKFFEAFNITDAKTALVAFVSALSQVSEMVMKLAAINAAVVGDTMMGIVAFMRNVHKVVGITLNEQTRLFGKFASGVGQTLAAALDPRISVKDAAKEQFKLLGVEAKASARRVQSAFARIDLNPFKFVLADAKNKLLDLRDQFTEQIKSDTATYAKAASFLDGILEGLKDFELEFSIPNITVEEEDRALLKKMFAPVALFGSQEANKILAGAFSGIEPAGPAALPKELSTNSKHVQDLNAEMRRVNAALAKRQVSGEIRKSVDLFRTLPIFKSFPASIQRAITSFGTIAIDPRDMKILGSILTESARTLQKDDFVIPQPKFLPWNFDPITVSADVGEELSPVASALNNVADALNRDIAPTVANLPAMEAIKAADDTFGSVLSSASGDVNTLRLQTMKLSQSLEQHRNRLDAREKSGLERLITNQAKVVQRVAKTPVLPLIQPILPLIKPAETFGASATDAINSLFEVETSFRDVMEGFLQRGLQVVAPPVIRDFPEVIKLSRDEGADKANAATVKQNGLLQQILTVLGEEPPPALELEQVSF
jgi:hypothetical protein